MAVTKADIRHIVAFSEGGRVIGDDGDIPWHLPSDLKRFRKLTMGHPIVMGRKTYESIGRVLDGRSNIILSKTLGDVEGAFVARDISSALVRSGLEGHSTIFVIGGKTIYNQTMHMASAIEATVVKDYDGPGDCFYPRIPEEKWDEEILEEYETHRYVRYTSVNS